MRSVRIMVLAVSASFTVLSSQGAGPVPVVRFVALEELGQRCAITDQVFACTVMKAHFSCACQRSASGWHLKAAASIVPRVFISRIAYLPHEMGHIRDISELVDMHVSTLISPTFAASDDCQRAARRAEQTFGERMREFQAISAQRRDGKSNGVSH